MSLNIGFDMCGCCSSMMSLPSSIPLSTTILGAEIQAFGALRPPILQAGFGMIELRPYQDESVASIIAEIERAQNPCIVARPAPARR